MLTKLPFCSVLFFLLFFGALHGQNYQIEDILNVEDGLPSNETYASFFDETGDLFVLTDKGLARYDGLSVKVYTERDGLPATAVFKHFRDYKGRDWLTTVKGVCYLENGNIVVPAFNKELRKKGSSLINNMFVTKKNEVYVTSENFTRGYFNANLHDTIYLLNHVGENLSNPFTEKEVEKVYYTSFFFLLKTVS